MQRTVLLTALILAGLQGSCSDSVLAPDAATMLEDVGGTSDFKASSDQAPGADADPALDQGTVTDGGPLLDQGTSADLSKPDLPTSTSGALFIGGVLSGEVDLSKLKVGASATHVAWVVSPQAGDQTTPTWPSIPTINNVTSIVSVTKLSAPIKVGRIPLPGPYVIWTRELSGGKPISGWVASKPDAVKQTAAATAKSWHAGLSKLLGHALGKTVGRTSAAKLKVIDGKTMSAAQIKAALPAGWSYKATNVTIAPPAGATAANPAVLQDYLLRGVKIDLAGGKDHVHIRQCVLYSPAYKGAPYVLIRRGARLREFSHNTVIGPRVFGGAGQVVQCQVPLSAGQGRGIVDTIAYNLVSGGFGDCFSTTGSPVTRAAPAPSGTWVHHNVLDAVAYVTGFSGSGNWYDLSNAPHGDLITVKGSYDKGTHIEDNIFWQAPVEPVTIPAALAHDKLAKIAGAARPYAGSRGKPLGDKGHSAQNNMVRIVQDNSQLVTSATWAGPVRITRFIHVKWAGMSGATIDMSGAAQAAKDTAIWDGIIGGKDGTQSYTPAAFSNLDLTTHTAYFHPSVTKGYYSGKLVNFWTGAAIPGYGSPGALASAL